MPQVSASRRVRRLSQMVEMRICELGMDAASSENEMGDIKEALS